MRIRDRVAIVAAAGALAAAVLGVGGALRPVQAAVAALVAIALAAQALSRRLLDRPSPLVVALAIATGLTALQLVPLPPGLVASLSPTGAALRAQGAALAGVTAWPSLSLDPAGTLAALAGFVVLLGGAVVALRLAATERGRHRLVAAVAGAAGAAAVIAGVHEVVGATALYGLYEPVQATPPLLGPLLNSNHLAGLTAMGAVAALGLFAHTGQRPPVRVVWALVAIACAVATVAGQSRGGVLALLAGLAVAGIALLAQRLRTRGDRNRLARRARFLVSSLPLAIVALCTLVLIMYASSAGVAQQLATTSVAELAEPRSKFAAWHSSLELVREAPWTGIGRGALEPAFTRVHPASAQVTFSHLENEYIQAVVEWGVPGALALALAVAWLGVTALRRWRDGPLAAGALGGLTVIAVQSNVDFGLSLLGVALPATALAATVAYVPLREAAGRALWRARALRGLHVAGLAAAALVLLAPISTPVTEDHEDWAERPASIEELRAAIARHPLDYLGYARAADALLREQDPAGVRYLSHALTLHPTHPGLHVIAARLLTKAGRDAQAAGEYAQAIRGRADPRPVIREVVAALRDPNLAVAAIPAELPNIDLVVRALQELERADLAARWLARVLETRPQEPRVCEYLYAISIEQGDLSAAEAAGRHCLAVVPSVSRRVALARVLAQRGAHSEVTQQLRDIATWRGRVDEIASAWLLLCDAHEALRAWADATRCLRLLDGRNLIEPRRRDEITRRIDRVAKARLEAELLESPPAPVIGPNGKVIMPRVLR